MAKGTSADKLSEQEILNRVFDPATATLATSGGGASTGDGDAFTPGSTEGTISMGVYESSPSTITNNDSAAIGIDVNRNVKVVEQYAPGYEDNTANVAKVEHRYSYQNITASGCPAGNIVATARFLHTVTVNQPVSAVTTVITDNTAAGGTLVGTIVNPTGAANGTPYTLVYDVSLTNGFAASQVSPIATGNNITISYRT